jgi:hypothetical protein
LIVWFLVFWFFVRNEVPSIARGPRGNQEYKYKFVRQDRSAG